MDSAPISSSEVEHFHREGYVVRQQFIDDDVVRLRHMVTSLLTRRPLPNPRIVVHSALADPDPSRFPSNPYATYHLVNTVLGGDKWLSLVADQRLIDSVSKIIGSSIDLDMAFLRMRPAGLKMDAPWHRDVDTDRFSDQRAVTALIYLHDMSEASGATSIVPASRGYSHASLESQGVTTHELEEAAVPIEQPAGTVLYLSPTVVHRGGWNRTKNESGIVAFEYRAAGTYRDSDEGEDLALLDLPIARPGWRLVGPTPWTSG